MSDRKVRLVFRPTTEMTEVHDTFALAVMACEGLFGSARVRTELTFEFVDSEKSCGIDVSNDVGSAVARSFIGILTREIGESGFRVEAVTK